MYTNEKGKHMEYVMNVLNWLNALNPDEQNLILAPVSLFFVVFVLYVGVNIWQWCVRPLLKGVHYVTIRPLTKTARAEKALHTSRKVTEEINKINVNLRGRLSFNVVYPKNNKHTAIATASYRLTNEPPVSASAPIVFDTNPALLRLSILQGFLAAVKQISTKETSWVNEEAKIKARKKQTTLVDSAFDNVKEYLQNMHVHVDFTNKQVV